MPRHNPWAYAPALLCALAWGAAAAPGAAKSQTLAQLIASDDSSGRIATIGPPLSTNLGFLKPPSGKTLSYEAKQAADKRDHDFTVVRASGAVAALVWDSTDVQAGTLDGYTFRSSADGKLQAGVRSHGVVGRVVQTKLDPAARSTQDAFQREVNFFLHQAPGLRPDR